MDINEIEGSLKALSHKPYEVDGLSTMMDSYKPTDSKRLHKVSCPYDIYIQMLVTAFGKKESCLDICTLFTKNVKEVVLTYLDKSTGLSGKGENLEKEVEHVEILSMYFSYNGYLNSKIINFL
jgi:hypothetical protein